MKNEAMKLYDEAIEVITNVASLKAECQKLHGENCTLRAHVLWLQSVVETLIKKNNNNEQTNANPGIQNAIDEPTPLP